MTRPFSLTMLAHQLDRHQLWTALLVTALVLSGAWGIWAVLGQVTVYEDSIRVVVLARVATQTTVEEHGNIEEVKAVRQRFVEADFPASTRASLSAGKQAAIFSHGGSGEQVRSAVITEVRDGKKSEPARVVLGVSITEGEPDPFDGAVVDRVRIAAGSIAPLQLLFPNLKLPGRG